jgi:hypothetical protein
MRKFLVPESVWDLRVAQLPGPARLHLVLKAVGVRTLRDLHGRRLAELRQQKNCGAVTIAALEELLQRAVSGEFDSSPAEEGNAFEALPNLIEAAIQRLPGDDGRLLLHRLGTGTSPPLTLEQVGTPRGLTRQGIRSILQTLFAEIRKSFGVRIPRLLDRVREYCISNVCPLTPQLLEDLAPGLQSQLRLSAEAHVRVIGALDKGIPCWPNRDHRYNCPDSDSRRLAAHVARIAWRARGPLTIAEAYRQLKTQRRHRSLTVPEYLRRLRNGRRIRIEFRNPQQPVVCNFRRLIHRHRSAALRRARRTVSSSKQV